MIVSHKYRFIFLKTRKTAGTSVEVFLSRVCGAGDIVTPINPPVPPHYPRNHAGFFNHIPGEAVRSRLGDEIWDSYFKFCIERNPWEKTLSYYHMMNYYKFRGTLAFDDFMKLSDFPVDHPIYTAPGEPGRILVDRVVPYEDLAGGLMSVFAELGIPFDGNLGVRAKSEYRKDRRPYREIYTPAQAEQVASAFAVEQGLFGYRF